MDGFYFRTSLQFPYRNFVLVKFSSWAQKNIISFNNIVVQFKYIEIEKKSFFNIMCTFKNKTKTLFINKEKTWSFDK